MGWKSTIDINKEHAKQLIVEQLAKQMTRVNELSDSELADMLETLGYGDNTNLPYYGYNFNIKDE